MNIPNCSGCGCHSSYPVRSCLWRIGDRERMGMIQSWLLARKRREGEGSGERCENGKRGIYMASAN